MTSAYPERVIANETPVDNAAGFLGSTADDFGRLAEPFRRELLVHCYRMLGSLDDAEDAVQEAFARAWRGRATFRRSISLRAWLYRIATNACLDAIGQRRRAPATGVLPEVEPIPDESLDDASTDPEARYDAHESISLAFLTALQLLPPRQRAVVILRDVLAWRAAEVAELLELSVPAVNSALHRARTTLGAAYRSPGAGRAGRDQPGHLVPDRLRDLLDRYVRAWEMADIAGLVALLRDDALVSMPPGLMIRGRDAIAAFLANAVFVRGLRIRLMPVAANRSPSFAIYSASEGEALKPFAILVVDATDASVTRMSVFSDRLVLDRFDLPETIPG